MVAAAPGVNVLTADNPSPMTGRGTNTYLLDGGFVVDPGPELASHLARIAAAGSPRALLVTHGHEDHLPGAQRLREQTGAPIVGHPALPGVDRPVADGETLELGDWRVQALATPGHALDHLCFWVADRRLLFSGDLVAGAGTIVLSDVPNALTLYLDSLARVLALGPSTLLPGHGPIVADGQAKVQEYVDHRLARERQIVSALVAAPATVEELVARIYIDTPAALHNAAARNVRAHLERLAVFGRATAVSGRWRLMGHPNPHDRS